LDTALSNKSNLGHGHSIAEVSSLGVALDNKSNLGHGHTQAEVSGLGSALAGKVDTSDTRLTNARTPTAHTHPIGDVTGLSATLLGKADLGGNVNFTTITQNSVPVASLIVSTNTPSGTAITGTLWVQI
jgi:hypothetical protein